MRLHLEVGGDLGEGDGLAVATVSEYLVESEHQLEQSVTGRMAGKRRRREKIIMTTDL